MTTEPEEPTPASAQSQSQAPAQSQAQGQPPQGFAPAPYYWGDIGWQVPPPPQPVGINGQAIAAFVLGLFAVVPAGVVFGVLALVRIGRTRQRGKGLAVAGLVLSGLWLLAAMGGVITAAVFYKSGHVVASGVSGSGTRSVSALPSGTCFNQPAGSTTLRVTVVPCAGLHDRQLFAKIDLGGPGSSYPGLDVDRQQARMVCIRAEYAAFTDPVGVAQTATLTFYYPEQSSWDDGDSQAWCALKAPYGQLTGDLRQSTSNYTADQQSFLALADPALMLSDEVLGTLPSQWIDGTVLATQLGDADRDEARALTSSKLFTSSFMKSAAAALAKDDLAQAARADKLAEVDSQSAWTSAMAAWNSTEFSSDMATLRINLGLRDR